MITLNHLFIETPLGIICLLLIGGVALFNIYHPAVEDGLFGRLLYMGTAMTCFVALFHFESITAAKVVTPTLIIIFALRQLRNVVLRLRKWDSQRRKGVDGAQIKR